MTEIGNLLRQEIGDRGAIPFDRFMEVALYCPKMGYYERDPRVIGFGGGFYTSPSVGPLFGQLLGAQFVRGSLELGQVPVDWVEGGAHDGTLAVTVLEWLGKNRPEVLEWLTYWIVEPSADRRSWQEEKLRHFRSKVRWIDSLADLKKEQITGLIFSNELLDAFPVHRVQWDGHQWFELGIDAEADRFVWTRLEEASIDIAAELERAGFPLEPELLAVIPHGFTVDISSAAGAWWKQAAEALHRGKLMTIDYGYTAEEFLKPERIHGTLRAYYKQRVSEDVLARPGEQDITAHVNFTQLQRIGEEAGLKTEMFLSQEAFLSTLLQREINESSSHPLSPAETRQFQTLTHPEQMGRKFRVLVQSR